jgi:hypothetical protein
MEYSMEINRFGQYLINNGIVKRTELNNALEAQRDKQIAIGVIAVEHKYLTMANIFEILKHQTDTSLYFGEAAVELGFLSTDEVNTLLTIQQATRPKVGDILVDMGLITSRELNRHLDRYFKIIENQDKNCEDEETLDSSTENDKKL